MKHFIILIALFTATLVTAQGSLEIGAGYFQNNIHETAEQMHKEASGGFVSIMAKQRTNVLQGLVEVRAKTNKQVEAHALVHFNFLWFFEDDADVFSNPNKNISLLVGSGYIWSEAYYNYFDIPLDMRLSIKIDKWRVQAGFQFPLMERWFYENNSEFSVSVFRAFGK